MTPTYAYYLPERVPTPIVTQAKTDMYIEGEPTPDTPLSDIAEERNEHLVTGMSENRRGEEQSKQADALQKAKSLNIAKVQKKNFVSQPISLLAEERPASQSKVKKRESDFQPAAPPSTNTLVVLSN